MGKTEISSRKLEIPKKHGMDLTETEDFKKRWQEYTEELCKNNNNNNNNDQITTMVQSLTYSQTS